MTTITSKAELFPISTEMENGFITQIGGVELNQLADEFGTPLYLYDAKTVYSNFQTLRKLLDHHYSGVSQIAYASKAYLSLKFARKLANLQTAIDVVSLSELEIALKAGFAPEKIHLHGNNKSESEIRKAIDSRIDSIVVDSLDELQFVEEISRSMNQTPNIWLRINPNINTATHKAVQTGHLASKFGIPIDGGLALHVIQEALQSSVVKLTGIHTHLGSQIFDPEGYSCAVLALMNLCKNARWQPSVISPGGGWGVPYAQDIPSSDPADWIKAISTTLEKWCSRENEPLPKLVIEPGRWMVARAGVSLYRVGTTKVSHDNDWVVAVDGGMADNPRPALYDSRYSAEFLGDASGRPIVQTRLVGRFCESGDELIHQISLPRLDRGDLVAIPVSGAYQLSMASNYNLADRPCAVWLENGQVEVLQNREKASESAWWLGE
jgi:diaminopimelate decarboxylase